MYRELCRIYKLGVPSGKFCGMCLFRSLRYFFHNFKTLLVNMSKLALMFLGKFPCSKTINVKKK